MGCEGRIQKALSGFYYVNTGAEVLTCRQEASSGRKASLPWWGIGWRSGSWAAAKGSWRPSCPGRMPSPGRRWPTSTSWWSSPPGPSQRQTPSSSTGVASIAALKGCDVVVLLNKCDLDRADELYEIYNAAGFPTLQVSAETGEGIEELKTPDCWEAICLYRKLRRWQIQYFKRPGPPNSTSRWGT